MPAPFLAIRPVRCRSDMLNDTSEKSTRSPMAFVRPWTSRMVAAITGAKVRKNRDSHALAIPLFHFPAGRAGRKSSRPGEPKSDLGAPKSDLEKTKTHLVATAVYFGDNVNPKGQSIMHKGKRFVVCDPTYQNASIGMMTPKYAKARYEIINIY